MATYIPPYQSNAGEDIYRGFQMFMAGMQHRAERGRSLFDMAYKVHNAEGMQEASKLLGSKKGLYPEEEVKTKLANMIVQNTEPASRKETEKKTSGLSKIVGGIISGAKKALQPTQDYGEPVDLSQKPTMTSRFAESPTASQYAMEGIGEPERKRDPYEMASASQGWAYQQPQRQATEVLGKGRDVRQDSMKTWDNYPEENITRIAVEGKTSDADADRLAKELVRYESKIKQDPSYAGRIAKALNISPNAIPVAYQKIQQPAPPSTGEGGMPSVEPSPRGIPTIDDIYSESKQGGRGRLADGLNVLRRRYSEEIQRSPKAAAAKAMDYMALEEQLRTYYGDSSESVIIKNLAKNLGPKLGGGGGGKGKEKYWLNEITGERVDNPPKNPDGTYVKGWRLMTPAVEQRYGEDLRKIISSEDVLVTQEQRDLAQAKLDALESGSEGMKKGLEKRAFRELAKGTPWEKVYFGVPTKETLDQRVASYEAGELLAGDTIAEDLDSKGNVIRYVVVRNGKIYRRATKEEVDNARNKGKK